MSKHWEFESRKALRELAYKQFQGKTRQDLIDEIIDLRTEVRELEKKNKKFDKAQSEQDIQPKRIEKNYRQSWSFATKIVFLLNKSQRPLTSRELHKELMQIDTHYPDYDDPKVNLSVVLGRSSKNKRIIKIKLPGIRELYFALPEWMDKEGKLEKDKQDFFKQF